MFYTVLSLTYRSWWGVAAMLVMAMKDATEAVMMMLPVVSAVM